MTDNFIVKYLFPEDEEAKIGVGDFASEFYSLYKSLQKEVKTDISNNFREKKIGTMALKRLYELLFQARQDRLSKSSSGNVLTIEL